MEFTSWTGVPLASLIPKTTGWLWSGCAILSLLLLLGPSLQLPATKWKSALIANGLYAVASTSWGFVVIYAVVCWPSILVVCLIQSSLVSSFTRARLRRVLNRMHFFRDKAALFDLPVLQVDNGIDGLVTVRGITASVLSLSLDIHGIGMSFNLGFGHEIIIHTEVIRIELFRRIAIDEVFVVHRYAPDGHNHKQTDEANAPSRDNSQTYRKPDSFSDKSDSGLGSGRKDSLWHGNDDVPISQPPAQRFSKDEQAEQRYRDVLKDVVASTQLHQCRDVVGKLFADGSGPRDKIIEIRASICAELKAMELSRMPGSQTVRTSYLITRLRPIYEHLVRMPLLLRSFLWLASQFHPAECPSICLIGSGKWLKEVVLERLFKRQESNDDRIQELEKETATWLESADYCLDFTGLDGQCQAPLRSKRDIDSEIRSGTVVVSRIVTGEESICRLATLVGADAAFRVPSSLLPCYPNMAAQGSRSRRGRMDAEQSKVSSEEGNDAEGARNKDSSVSISIRCTLPATFHSEFLSFAATLSKRDQLLDIEDESGLPESVCSLNQDQHADSQDHHMREKILHNRVGTALKHPAQLLKQRVHREVKKTAVKKTDSGWFAKWTNKLLEQLQGMDGDVGYTVRVPVNAKGGDGSD